MSILVLWWETSKETIALWESCSMSEKAIINSIPLVDLSSLISSIFKLDCSLDIFSCVHFTLGCLLLMEAILTIEWKWKTPASNVTHSRNNTRAALRSKTLRTKHETEHMARSKKIVIKLKGPTAHGGSILKFSALHCLPLQLLAMKEGKRTSRLLCINCSLPGLFFFVATLCLVSHPDLREI